MNLLPHWTPSRFTACIDDARRLLAVLVLAVFGGCASDGSLDDRRDRDAVHGDSTRQPVTPSDKPLLDGGLKLRLADSLIRYDANYAIKPGTMPTASSAMASSSFADDRPASRFGGESFAQSFKTQVPFLLASPLQLGAQERYQGLLTPQGLNAARTAQLVWSPTPAKLGLQWSNLDPATAQPFDCGLRGSVDVPGPTLDAGANDLLKFSGLGCRVIAPDRGIANLDVNSYSAAWQWRGGAGESAVHLTMIEPLRGGASGVVIAVPTAISYAPGYEIGASRSQTRGAITAKTSVAVRQATDPLNQREAIGWSARTTVSRQFRDVAVSASLQHAADPLWFVPASNTGGNSVELGFDFRRWIEQQLATRKVGLGLTWSWIEPALPSQPIDRRVLWNFSLTP